MEAADYLRLIPEEPPEETVAYLRSKKKLGQEYLVYRAGWERDPLTGTNERCADCHCTACGMDFKLGYVKKTECPHHYSSYVSGFELPDGEKFSSGETLMCPACGEPVKALHTSEMGKDGVYKAEYCHVLTVHEAEGRAILATWVFYKTVDREGNDRIRHDKYEAIVYDAKKWYKACGYVNSLYTRIYTPDWNARAQCRDTYGQADLILPFDRHLLDGTPLENAKLWEYCRTAGAFPITYLRLWQKHNNVENLIVQGMARLVSDAIEKTANSYYAQVFSASQVQGINFRAKKPNEMLGLTKDEFAEARREKWGADKLAYFQKLKEIGQTLRGEELKRAMLNTSIYELGRYADSFRPEKETAARTMRYVDKQRRKYPADNASISGLIDYWRFMRELGDPLETPDNVYPQRLRTAHDDAAKRFEAHKKKIFDKKFADRMAGLMPLACTDGALTVVVPKKPEDLRREGRELHHCVGTYVDRVARGETTILFVRRVGAESKPFYTMEYDMKKQRIIQNHTSYNKGQTEEILVFEKFFLAHAAEVIKRKEVKA